MTNRTGYEVRVAGTLGPAAREAFSDLYIEVEPQATLLCGQLDQAALHGIIDRIRALGLELMDIRRVRQIPAVPPGVPPEEPTDRRLVTGSTMPHPSQG